MNGASHLIGGITAAVVLGIHSPAQLAVVAVSSLLPDIDRSNSLLGRWIPVLPSVLERTLGKRTLTHSLLFGFGIWLLLGAYPALQWAFVIGYLSHLLLDVVTGRIALLWPLPLKFGVPLFGIPPVFVETLSLAGWGAWMVIGGYQYFQIWFS
ncbi:metal-dependent hydrolase [Paenibacillus polymyxa]|uniref:metal-dependent hydrolase n=1 Tax=Paenibacillus polymyxa TaxID=1406 RepID=UPI002AB593D4|nr:metal-dependent hydrolase [Paenibacillus polymyxa]MDY7989810.1 metal-dependent hydrolase [Paenibacillus polymyxa]MDY8116831.1 metal-dependent hydrolase [Paenibacillus polymyxa]